MAANFETRGTPTDSVLSATLIGFGIVWMLIAAAQGPVGPVGVDAAIAHHGAAGMSYANAGRNGGPAT